MGERGPPRTMRLSELIAHAQSALKVHGDMPVHVELTQEDEPFDERDSVSADKWEVIGAPVTRTPSILRGRVAIARTSIHGDRPSKRLFVIGG